MFGLAVGLVILITFELLFLLVATANEAPGWGFFSLVATVVAADFFWGTGVGIWIWENPGYAVVWFVGYLILGTGWSFFRWLMFLRREVNSAREEKKKIYAEYKIDSTTSLEEAAAIIREQTGGSNGWPLGSVGTLIKMQVAPQVSDHKQEIVTWISAWPFDLIWFLLDEPIQVIWDWCRGTYQRLSDRMWSI